MSGTAEPVRPAKNDPEWARETTRRLDSVENPTSQRVGEWVLSTSAEGHLIGSHVEGGSVILARKPSTGENDPDAIQDNVIPALSVTRSVDQSVASTGTKVIFDGTRLELGGNWTGGMSTFDSVAVPVDGTYWCSAAVQFKAGPGYFFAGIWVDDVATLSGKTVDSDGGSWLTTTVADLVQLRAGQKITLYAALGGGVVGSSATSSTPVPTSMSLFLVQRSI